MGYAVYARLADNRLVRCTEQMGWDHAQEAWRALADAHRAGRMPHVLWYAVRSADDPQWAHLRYDQLAVVPVPHRGGPQLARLTRNQGQVLLRLGRYAGTSVGGWVHHQTVGQPMALHHLYTKGYADRDERVGPRGGVQYVYRPSLDGWGWVARQLARTRQRVAA